jgi:hypothetical protein
MGLGWGFGQRLELDSGRRRDTAGLERLAIGYTWSGDGREGNGSEMRWWRKFYKSQQGIQGDGERDVGADHSFIGGREQWHRASREPQAVRQTFFY